VIEVYKGLYCKVLSIFLHFAKVELLSSRTGSSSNSAVSVELDIRRCRVALRSLLSVGILLLSVGILLLSVGILLLSVGILLLSVGDQIPTEAKHL